MFDFIASIFPNFDVRHLLTHLRFKKNSKHKSVLLLSTVLTQCQFFKWVSWQFHPWKHLNCSNYLGSECRLFHIHKFQRIESARKQFFREAFLTAEIDGHPQCSAASFPVAVLDIQCGVIDLKFMWQVERYVHLASPGDSAWDYSVWCMWVKESWFRQPQHSRHRSRILVGKPWPWNQKLHQGRLQIPAFFRL